MNVAPISLQGNETPGTSTSSVIVIPALEPNEKLLALVADLRKRELAQVVIVDDGSSAACDALFIQLERNGARVLHHAANLGKGAALKTGIAAARTLFPEASHIVTADADGQHTPDDIMRVSQAAQGHHEHVVIGVRDLSGRAVPLRSRLGNAFSAAYFRLDTGVNCPDTQTGLRAIPVSLASLATSVPGTRYEYEMNFLTTVANRGIPLVMVPIETIYEHNNAGSHFRTVRDSARIYRQFFRFAGSSLACSLVDLGLFALAAALINLQAALAITAATVIARLASGLLNFALNRQWSFADAGSDRGSARAQATRYALLFCMQMLASAGLVTFFSAAPLPLVLVKALVDGSLFIVSFFVQRNWVFKDSGRSHAASTKGGRCVASPTRSPESTV